MKNDFLTKKDFEATCDEDGQIQPPEIIEFPAVAFNNETMLVDAEFQCFVRPKVNPILTPYCTKLTGIKQQWVNDGVFLGEAMERFHLWMEERQFVGSRSRYSFAMLTVSYA